MLTFLSEDLLYPKLNYSATCWNWCWDRIEIIQLVLQHWIFIFVEKIVRMVRLKLLKSLTLHAYQKLMLYFMCWPLFTFLFR